MLKQKSLLSQAHYDSMVAYLRHLHDSHQEKARDFIDNPNDKSLSANYDRHFWGNNNPFYQVSSDGVVTTHRNIFCVGVGLNRGRISEGGYQEAVEELQAAGFVRFKFGFGLASEGWTLPEFLPATEKDIV